MKLLFLGTSAGESYPAIWCHCPNCEYARTHGGRNIRGNSCALIDDDLMLDMSHHAFDSALRFGADITRIRRLFVTHDHQDHFYPQHLTWRGRPFFEGSAQEIPERFDVQRAIQWMGALQTPVPYLNVYGHISVWEALKSNHRFHPENMEENYRMSFNELHPGDVTSFEHTTVTAVTSQHSQPGSVLNYIIERDGKTLLYALDCGGYDADMLAIIRSKRYDCVVLEGTFGEMPVEWSMHQNLNKNLRMLDFFSGEHLWKDQPNLVLSHMAPHWTPPYDVYVERVAPYGIRVAYDGMTLEI